MRLQGEEGFVKDLEPEDFDKETQTENVKLPDARLEIKSEVPLPTGPGYRLRMAREAMNLTQEEVAARLRLTRQMIQYIDMDNYTLPTPKTFVRGYLRSYAKLVDVSPDEIVAAFEMIPMQEQAMQVQLPSPATRQTWRKQESSVRWFIYVVASLVIVTTALGYQWWHSYNKVVPSEPIEKTAQQPAVPEIAAGQLVQPSNMEAPQIIALDLKFTAPVTVKMVDREGKILHEGKYDRNDHVTYDQVAAYEILVDEPDNITVRYHGRLLMPVRYPGEDFARIILQ